MGGIISLTTLIMTVVGVPCLMEREASVEETKRKRISAVWGTIMGGLILIFLGILFYLSTILGWENIWPLFLVLIGVLIIISGVVRYYSGEEIKEEKF